MFYDILNYLSFEVIQGLNNPFQYNVWKFVLKNTDVFPSRKLILVVWIDIICNQEQKEFFHSFKKLTLKYTHVFIERIRKCHQQWIYSISFFKIFFSSQALLFGFISRQKSGSRTCKNIIKYLSCLKKILPECHFHKFFIL